MAERRCSGVSSDRGLAPIRADARCRDKAVRPDPRVRRGPHRRAKEPPLLSGEFLIISGEGQAFGEDDAETWLRETGWHKAERRPLGGPSSVIIAEAI